MHAGTDPERPGTLLDDIVPLLSFLARVSGPRRDTHATETSTEVEGRKIPRKSSVSWMRDDG